METIRLIGHRFRLRVYYEDTDAGGIVYHASYLRFAERARTEALRDAGAPHAELVDQHGMIFVVRQVDMRYLRPARLDDEVEVITETTELGGATATLRQAFRCSGREIAVLVVQLACIRAADARPVRMPERWRNALVAGMDPSRVREGAEP